MKDHTKELASFLEQYIESQSISFIREDPRALASWLAKVFSVFYLAYSEDTYLEAIKERTLYSLWNFVIDDIIDYGDGGKENIIESFQAITRSRQYRQFDGKTEAGRIMYDLIQRFHELPLGPNNSISEELLFLDLTRVLNGFDYERVVLEHNTTPTLSEYLEFGAVTIDVRVALDIDIAVYPHDLSPSVVGDLREAYRWFGLAFKLSSDIATFEREFFLESTHNAVILLGKQIGKLPGNVLECNQETKRQLFKDVIPSVMKEIKIETNKFLSKSLECLDRIDEVDTKNLSQAFRSMVEEYPGQKMFAPPAMKKD